MAVTKNDFANGVKPMPVAQGSEIVSVPLVVDVAAAPVVNDIVIIGFLPEDHVPVDYIVTSDDMDTNGTPTLEFTLGVLNEDQDDIDTTARGGGAAWGTAINVAETGGFARATTKPCANTPPSSSDRKAIGIKWSTAAATFAAGALTVNLLYRAANYGK
jgi:hypothetical protein